ncbi:MAG: pyruvate formate lyase activating enzyme [Verrucomicrobiota bacterium]|nr:pyruvate formate lyase activating enzyme [Verrucomicrobiota bacterium]
MSKRGIVTDIQRASLHDGPGIRTTIFLKGCPLQCLWCHNPEAIAPRPQLFFAEERCVACGSCEAVCSNGVHHVGPSDHAIEFGQCATCSRCVDECNSRGLRIVGKEMDADAIMAEVLADVEFYRNSGGGMTLSGGEPLYQQAFALELLNRAKQMNIHTCVETSGFVAAKKFEAVLPAVDLLLFDYKATKDEDHRSFTGVSNELILANLDTAYQRGNDILLRCPIVPGLNDTAEHFAGIRALDEKYPRIRGIELMPYHDFGNSKRPSIGIAEASSQLRVPTATEPGQWIEALNGLGCQKVRIG